MRVYELSNGVKTRHFKAASAAQALQQYADVMGDRLKNNATITINALKKGDRRTKGGRNKTAEQWIMLKNDGEIEDRTLTVAKGWSRLPSLTQSAKASVKTR